jgi:iron complex outermembrane receptor protein
MPVTRRASARLAVCLSLGLAGGPGADAVSTDEAGTGVAGIVRSLDGTPLAGAVVRLRHETNGRSLRTASGAGGVFRLSGLAPGAWELSAELPGFVAASERVTVEAAALSEVALELAPAFTVRETLTVIGSAPRDSLEAARLRESGARDVGDALEALPGVWKLRKGGIANDVVVRGLQSRDLNVLVDGQKLYGACPGHMDPPVFHADFAEVERVEIGKGPFDLKSQGSLGGSVNVVTRRPEEGLHARAVLSAGSYGFVNPSATLSYGAPSFSAVAGYSQRRSDAFRDGWGRRFTERANYRPENADRSAFDVGTAWGRLAWSPAAGHQLDATYTRQDASDVLYPYLLMDARWDDLDRAGLRYEWQRPDSALRALRAQVYFNRVDHWMTDELRASSQGAPRGYSMGTLASTRTGGGRVEATLHGLTLGVEGFDRNWDATNEMAMMGYRPQAILPDVSIRGVGAYAEYQRSPGARLGLVAGARLDHARTEADPARADTALYFAYHGTRATARRDDFASGHVRLRWRRGGFEAGAGLGSTVRVPDQQERFFAQRRMGADWVGNPDLEPARNTGLEASLGWQGRGVALSLEGFWTRVDGFIGVHEQPRLSMVAGVMNTRARSYTNLDARLRGAEARLSASLPLRLALSAELSYVHGAQTPDPARNVSSTRLAEVPPLRARASLRFDDGRFSAAVEGVASAAQRRVDADLREAETPGWGVANLHLGYRQGRLTATLGVANLLDRDYREHLSYQRDPFRSGVSVHEPGRNVFVNLGLRF